MIKKKKANISVLRGWRLKLFNSLLDDGLIEIKNKRLLVTDKFMIIINKGIKKRNRKRTRR